MFSTGLSHRRPRTGPRPRTKGGDRHVSGPECARKNTGCQASTPASSRYAPMTLPHIGRVGIDERFPRPGKSSDDKAVVDDAVAFKIDIDEIAKFEPVRRFNRLNRRMLREIPAQTVRDRPAETPVRAWTVAADIPPAPVAPACKLHRKATCAQHLRYVVAAVILREMDKFGIVTVPPPVCVSDRRFAVVRDDHAVPAPSAEGMQARGAGRSLRPPRLSPPDLQPLPTWLTRPHMPVGGHVSANWHMGTATPYARSGSARLIPAPVAPDPAPPLP